MHFHSAHVSFLDGPGHLISVGLFIIRKLFSFPLTSFRSDLITEYVQCRVHISEKGVVIRCMSCSLKRDGQEETPGEEKGQGMGRKAPVSELLQVAKPCGPVSPASAHPQRQTLCNMSLEGARSRLGCFFTPVVCGRINQKIAAHQALKLELNPFKSVSLSSHPPII